MNDQTNSFTKPLKKIPLLMRIRLWFVPTKYIIEPPVIIRVKYHNDEMYFMDIQTMRAES